MSLCPEAAAFLGTPRVTVRPTRSVRLLTGKEPKDELLADIPTMQSANEDTIPKTSTTEEAKPKRKYTRRQPAGCAASIESVTTIATTKKRRAPVPAENACIFSVDSTGALLIRRGDHGMYFSASEFGQLVEFLERAEDMLKPQIERGTIV